MFVPVYAMQCIGASFTLHYIKLSKRCTLLFGVSRSPYVSFYHTEIFAVLVNTQKMRAHKPTPLHFSLHTPPFGSWLWNRWDSSRQERKRERDEEETMHSIRQWREEEKNSQHHDATKLDTEVQLTNIFSFLGFLSHFVVVMHLL